MTPPVVATHMISMISFRQSICGMNSRRTLSSASRPIILESSLLVREFAPDKTLPVVPPEAALELLTVPSDDSRCASIDPPDDSLCVLIVAFEESRCVLLVAFEGSRCVVLSCIYCCKGVALPLLSNPVGCSCMEVSALSLHS
jgi:hypothetical protein